MKKFSLLIAVLFAFTFANAQNQSFEDGFPENWHRFAEGDENVADTSAWVITEENPNTGDYGMKMTKFTSNADCWLVTKRFNAGGATVKFFAGDTEGWEDGDDLEVYVSTKDTMPISGSDFEADPIYTVSQKNDSEMHEHTVPLADYDGQNIYVGFLIANDGNQDGWWLDDVSGLSEPTAVSNVSEPKANLYPNPVSSKLKVQNFAAQEARLYNSSGKLLKVIKPHAKNWTMNMEAFDAGVYFIELKNEQATFTRRIIKE